jgi:hypothetical protein
MITSVTRDKFHRERVAQKYETLEGLKALYAAWEQKLEVDDEYMKHLRDRIHKCETQLNNMRP